MRKIVASVMLVAVAAPMLGGCSSWFGGAHAARSQPATKSAPMSPQEAALMAGKDALRQGQYAAAITDFRIARLDPALEAEAYNGLAIAYSNIGRPDLSDRYFRQAVALAPQDQRFAANLARFQAISSKASASAPVLAEAPPAPQPALAKASAIVAAAPSGGGSAVVIARTPEPLAEPSITVSRPPTAMAAVAPVSATAAAPAARPAAVVTVPAKAPAQALAISTSAAPPARAAGTVAPAPRAAAPAARAPVNASSSSVPAATARLAAAKPVVVGAPVSQVPARARPAVVAVAAPAIVVSRLSAHEVSVAPAPAARPRPAAVMAVRRPAPAPARPVASMRLALAERPAVIAALQRGERPGRLIGY